MTRQQIVGRAARRVEARHGTGLDRVGRDLLVDELMRLGGVAPFAGAAKDRQYARLKPGERALIFERARRLAPAVQQELEGMRQELDAQARQVAAARD